MTSESELKPCPFCGGDVFFYKFMSDVGPRELVKCDNCQAELCGGPGAAVAEWNDSADLVEAVEQRGYARGIEAAHQKISEMWASTTQEHMDAISALSPTPPAPVTVQEAARVLLRAFTSDDDPTNFNPAWNAFQAAMWGRDESIYSAMSAFFRALAEQDEPSTPPRDGVE